MSQPEATSGVRLFKKEKMAGEKGVRKVELVGRAEAHSTSSLPQQ